MTAAKLLYSKMRLSFFCLPSAAAGALFAGSDFYYGWKPDPYYTYASFSRNFSSSPRRALPNDLQNPLSYQLPEKAGLFNANNVTGMSLGGKYYPSMFYVASCDIEKNGKFKFSNLGDEEYCLAFMFKGNQTQEGKTIKATPNPGYIKLNKKNPIKNCGRIKIIRVNAQGDKK